MVRPTVDVPLLMIAFNRPEKTQRVFDAVRAAAPRRLYLAADGPRADAPSDFDRCRRARMVLENVDWPCKVPTALPNRQSGLQARGRDRDRLVPGQ
jgi:hypothetical protein